MTALLLALAAVMFSLGTHLERQGHRESVAEHASEAGGAASPSTTPAPSPNTTRTAALPAVRTPVAPSSKDAGLSAPEGSKEREAAERRRRASNHPTAVSSGLSASAQIGSPKPSAQTSSTPAVPDAAAPEGSAGREASEAAGSSRTATSEASERLFGMSTESTPVIVAADLLAAALIALLLFAPGRVLRLTGLAVLVTSGGALVLDVREGLRQNSLGRTGLVTLVVLVAVLHVSGAVLGGRLATRHARS